MPQFVFFTVGRLRKQFCICWILVFTCNHLEIATSLQHGVVPLAADYRPIDCRCLTLFIHRRSSLSQFVKIVPKTSRPSVDFRSSIGVCRPTCNKKNQMPKCQPSDDRHEKLSVDGRTMMEGCLTDYSTTVQLKTSSTDVEKFLTWPDGHKIGLPPKKKSIPAKTTADELPTVVRIIPYFPPKTVGRWSFFEMWRRF